MLMRERYTVYLLSVIAASDAPSPHVSNGRDNSRAGVREREQQRQAHAHGTRTTSGAQCNRLSSALHLTLFYLV